jgi:hypothetical protein
VSTVQEIAAAIEKLGEGELADLKAWLWDRDFERDVAAGRLDAVAEDAIQEYGKGHAKPL